MKNTIRKIIIDTERLNEKTGNYVIAYYDNLDFQNKVNKAVEYKSNGIFYQTDWIFTEMISIDYWQITIKKITQKYIPFLKHCIVSKLSTGEPYIARADNEIQWIRMNKEIDGGFCDVDYIVYYWKNQRESTTSQFQVKFNLYLDYPEIAI